MKPDDYIRCARRIATALQLEEGERVVLKLDTRVFGHVVPPLQDEIRRARAVVSGVVLAEDTDETSDVELESLRKMFDDADVFIWLPEVKQHSRPALAAAIVEWLDSGRGRAVHFHWHSGSYPVAQIPLPSYDIVDGIYLEALDVKPEDLERRHRIATETLRCGPVRVTTPEGTNLTFVVGDRPFCSQIGDATRSRMQSARTRIDRDIELPAGVLRVAPLESSANGTIFLPTWRPVATQGRNLLLHFKSGYVTHIDGENGETVLQELDRAGGASRKFREFALGFNPALRLRPECPFIGYYGYGSGIVRLSLGDNEEMGGANRGGGVYWNFLHNAAVEVESGGRWIKVEADT